MTALPRAPISGFLGDEYNSFLFATVCNEQSGRALSVVSLLARRDLDPWAQAAGFVRMPRRQAVSQLAEMIAGLPEQATMNETPSVAASRLIGLLPSTNTPKPAKSSRWQNIKRRWRAAFAG